MNFPRVVLNLLCIFAFCEVSLGDGENNEPSIAIIGAGIGGASAAFYLREKFGANVNIDVFEAKDVGGRMATVSIDGRQYESGGSIIHPANMYMVNFTKLLGLSAREKLGGEVLGLYDGTQMVFEGSSWGPLTVAKLFWRYGWDMYRINTYVEELIDHFSRIYEHQQAGLAFSTVEKLLSAMSPAFPEDLHLSIQDKLKQAGFSSLFVDELVMGGMRTNYGQTTTIQSFVGSVSLAGVQHGLWNIHGGNKLVPEGLIEQSKANLIRAKVNKVELLSNSQYKLEFGNAQTATSKQYNIVIIAAPLHDKLTGIKFENFPKPIADFPQPFHRTLATFVSGIPNMGKFGYKNLNDFPTALLTTKKDLFFNSIGKHIPVDYLSSVTKPSDIKPVYKVFSNAPLTTEQLDELFISQEEHKVVDWMAYPNYRSDEKDLPPFVLHNNLYYVNAIEMAASAMEMSAIGGRNAALLAYNKWSHIDKVDRKMTQHQTKSEL